MGVQVLVGDVRTQLRCTEAQARHLHHLLGALPLADGPVASWIEVVEDDVVTPAWTEPGDVQVTVDGAMADVVHSSGGWARVVDGRATITVGRGTGPVALRRLFSVALAFAIGPQDRTLLHGGAVAAGPGAVLVLGPSGAGKSTVVVAALAHGRRAWSDDLLVARGAGAGLEVAGLPRPLAVGPEVVEQLGLAAAPEDEGRGRTLLSPGCFEDGWVPLVGAVVVGHGDRSHVERVGAAAALPALVGAHLAGWSPELLGRWYPHAAAMARGATWSLTHDPDPAPRLAALPALLEQLDQDVD